MSVTPLNFPALSTVRRHINFTGDTSATSAFVDTRFDQPFSQTEGAQTNTSGNADCTSTIAYNENENEEEFTRTALGKKRIPSMLDQTLVSNFLYEGTMALLRKQYF